MHHQRVEELDDLSTEHSGHSNHLKYNHSGLETMFPIWFMYVSTHVGALKGLDLILQSCQVLTAKDNMVITPGQE